MNEAIVVLVRGLIGFFTLLIFARVLGKQQISQLTLFDYVLGITIGSTAATMTTDLSSAAWPHWIGLLIWVCAGILAQWVTVKSRFAAWYINGEPVIVIMNGKIMEQAMKKMRYSIGDLLEQLRLKDVFNINEVEFAVLETNGQLSVLRKSQYQNVTPNDLNIKTNYEGLTTEVIYDGLIIESNLKRVNLDKMWLEKELKKKGIKSPAQVFLASLDTSGQLFIDTYKDRVNAGNGMEYNTMNGGSENG